MGKAGKQADRKAAKVGGKQTEEEPASAAGGSFVAAARSLALTSCLAQVAVHVPKFLQGGVAAVPKKVDEKTEEKEETEGNAEPNGEISAAATFEVLGSRLTWQNALGLFPSGEKAVEAFKAIKIQELDFGPRAKKNGSPGLDRVSANLSNNLAQYVYVLFSLMLVRALLARSFFACLPWLFFYQFASLVLPTTEMEQFGQKIPLDKVPVNFRVVGTVGIHALLWLFFLYELVLKTYFMEKLFLIGLVLYHSYAVRPAEA